MNDVLYGILQPWAAVSDESVMRIIDCHGGSVRCTMYGSTWRLNNSVWKERRYSLDGGVIGVVGVFSAGKYLRFDMRCM